MPAQDQDDVASQRLHSFKMGGPARSRSKSSSFSPPGSPPIQPRKRPASHHHRRSSVSTRRESAELMGLSLPNLPPAHSDDNVNLGDKDSIRRRALWALEGKPDIAFSRVEIPDIPCFEFPTKPSFPPGSGLNPTNAKRDSFGKMFGSASLSKDQLGTLLEEEEEEDDSQCSAKFEERNQASPPKTVSRHRPASLNLRPLSLVQGSVVSALSGSLPTPSSSTPANTSIPLRQRPSSGRFSYACSDTTSAPCNLGKKRRSSISYKRSSDSIPREVFPLPTPEVTPTERRFSFASDHESLVEQPLSVADQHFLFRSHHVLLSRITDLERTLKRQASRSRHLSYSSDASAAASEPSDEMLQLISDLKAERDELRRDVDGWRLRVADADKHASLLAKRIESERRDAWVARNRLDLLEVEKSALEKSIAAKVTSLSTSLAENEALMRERDGMKDDIMKLNARLMDADAAIDESTRLRGALEQERTRRKELEKLLDDAGLLNTPKLPHAVNGSWRWTPFPVKPADARPRGLGFQSVDSESSTTDVESLDDSFTKPEFTLDVVAEEEVEYSDEEDGLAGYEDEEDSDLSFSSPGGSSIGSADELNITPPARTDNHSVSLSLPTRSAHESRASLSKTWTFPRGKAVPQITQDDEVDRFFGCLDDADRSPPRSEETNRSVFSSGFRSMSDDDELPPFVLPSDVGVVVESMSTKSLDVVPEEDEEDGVADVDDGELIGEEVEGGIRFTFNAPPIISMTPPPEICVTPPPEIHITPPLETLMTTPARSYDSASSKSISIPELVDDDQDKSSLTFVSTPPVQPRRVEGMVSPPRSSPPTSGGGSRPSSRNGSSPSSIPRAISLRSMSPSVTFTPSKNASARFAAPLAYSRPPLKTSSIPQPVTSPRFNSTPMKAQTSVVLSKQSQSNTPNGSSKLYTTNAPVSALRCPSPTQGGGATSEMNHPDASTCEYSHAQDTLSFLMSKPLAARSPFRTLSNLISFSWTPGATAVASYIIPGSSGAPNVESVDTADPLSNGTTRPAQRRFVSRARQLEKLRSRLYLEEESGITPCFAVSACKGCGTDNVYL